MDAMRQALLAALALQADWGADEALEAAPIDRAALRVAAPASAKGTPVQLPSPAQRPSAPAPVLGTLPRESAATALAAAADSLDALRAAIVAFDHPLRDTATSLVFAEGAAAAGLMLIGEAPGAEEDRQGRPFVGPAGQLLDRMLASVDITRADRAYLAHLLPWRPPGNRAPTEAEVAVFLPFLLRHVALVQPRRLVLLGGLPTKALLRSREPITRLRGRWAQVTTMDGLTIPALPMLHPAYLLRTPSAKRDAWADLRTLRATLDDE